MALSLDSYAMQLVRAAANAFFYPLKAAHYLELVTPLWNYAQIQARVEDVIRETHNTITLVLRPGKGWRLQKAGQYVRIGVSIEGKRHVRTYSISSAPERNDGLITITIKIQGRVSQYLANHARPGFYIALSQPEGNFVLPQSLPEKLLFITAGSGITPVMSLLRSLAASKKELNIVHIHYAKNPDDVIFGNELAAMRQHFAHHLIRVYTQTPSQSLASNHVRLTAATLNAFCRDWSQRISFACGPQGLLDEAERIWSREGIPEKLFIERFHAKKATLTPDAAGGRIRFVSSHFEAHADGTTPILKVAEAVGLNPPHGCRMGICHSCDAILRSGEVRDLRTGEKITCSDQIKVQICVCAAAGDVDIEI